MQDIVRNISKLIPVYNTVIIFIALVQPEGQTSLLVHQAEADTEENYIQQRKTLFLNKASSLYLLKYILWRMAAFLAMKGKFIKYKRCSCS